MSAETVYQSSFNPFTYFIRQFYRGQYGRKDCMGIINEKSQLVYSNLGAIKHLKNKGYLCDFSLGNSGKNTTSIVYKLNTSLVKEDYGFIAKAVAEENADNGKIFIPMSELVENKKYDEFEESFKEPVETLDIIDSCVADLNQLLRADIEDVQNMKAVKNMVG